MVHSTGIGGRGKSVEKVATKAGASCRPRYSRWRIVRHRRHAVVSRMDDLLTCNPLEVLSLPPYTCVCGHWPAGGD